MSAFATVSLQCKFKEVFTVVVKELLVYEDLITTQIYSHLQKQNSMDAVNLL
jgi:site-specific recombinase XerD